MMTPKEEEGERHLDNNELQQQPSQGGNDTPRPLRLMLGDDTSTVDVHGNAATEQNGDDANGEQGGQYWSRPTRTPTTPRTREPTGTPTGHPSIAGELNAISIPPLE